MDKSDRKKLVIKKIGKELTISRLKDRSMHEEFHDGDSYGRSKLRTRTEQYTAERATGRP